VIRAVLFDAVGTLIHLRAPVGETYTSAARARGIAADAGALQGAFDAAMRALPPMVFPKLPAAAVAAGERDWWRRLVHRVFAAAGAAGRPEDVDAVFDGLFAHFASADAWVAADGAAALLTRLRARGLRTGMVSNFDHRLRGLLDALGLAAGLDTVVLPADAGAAKPDPRIFALALTRLGVAAAEAVYVGDDAEDDVAGAQRAGMRAIDVGTLSELSDVEWLLD
jgi:putative hydrolase of the HAD superfamily